MRSPLRTSPTSSSRSVCPGASPFGFLACARVRHVAGAWGHAFVVRRTPRGCARCSVLRAVSRGVLSLSLRLAGGLSRACGLTHRRRRAGLVGAGRLCVCRGHNYWHESPVSLCPAACHFEVALLAARNLHVVPQRALECAPPAPGSAGTTGTGTESTLTEVAALLLAIAQLVSSTGRLGPQELTASESA